jgi:uncharacterized protein (DUF849 family)
MDSLTIMVAPNGARRMHTDHPALPVTIPAIARACAEVHALGAQAVHVHVRDSEGRHCLDAGLYQALTDAILMEAGPGLIVQATTEAVGRFSPAQQIALVRTLRPEAVSIALKELAPDEASLPAAAALYDWAHAEGIAVQHILYSVEELDRFLVLVAHGAIPGDHHAVLFPLGRTNRANPQMSCRSSAGLRPVAGLIGQTGWSVRSATVRPRPSSRPRPLVVIAASASRTASGLRMDPWRRTMPRASQT